MARGEDSYRWNLYKILKFEANVMTLAHKYINQYKVKYDLWLIMLQQDTICSLKNRCLVCLTASSPRYSNVVSDNYT